jgi:DNA-binding MarR family transcriptional regulator
VTTTIHRDTVPGADELLAELDPIIARQRQVMAQVWQDRSISKSNLHILMLLEQTDQLPMSRIASLLGVSLPSLTGIVDRMEEHGLVERDRDDADRRVVLVRSTPKGMAIVKEMEVARTRYLRGVLAGLSSPDRVTCLAAFKAMRDVAEKLDAASSPTQEPGLPPIENRRQRSEPAGQ